MKLIGSYTSPFVRKISVILLEKAIPFEFVNEFPYHETNGVAQYNPLGKVPALVTDDGDCWYDSPIIAQYLELLGIAPAMLPAEPKAALKLRQIEALADGVMEAAQTLVREKGSQRRSSRKANCCASAKRSRAVSMRWKAMRVTERCALMRLIWRPSPQPAPSLISISAASRQAGAPPDRSWSVWWIPSFSAPALRAPNRR